MKRYALPLLGATTVALALAGGLVLGGAAPDDRTEPAVVAQGAVDPVPLALAGEDDLVAERKAHARTSAAAAQAAAEQAAAAQAAAEQAALAQAAADRTAAAERASRSARDADPRQIARGLLAVRGQADQFSCLDSLWTKESDWQVDADNPTSSAYGIPQSLPGEKMASAGADWRTNPTTQIRWGLDYIEQSYGSPCAAWRHSQANDWY